MKTHFKLIVTFGVLLALSPTGYAQSARLIWKALAAIATGVSVANAGVEIGHYILPPVTDKITVGSREGIFSSKLVLKLQNTATDAVTNITIVYTVSGKQVTFSVGTIEPGQSKEFGWWEGAPMLQPGDSINISSDGTRSVRYNF